MKAVLEDLLVLFSVFVRWKAIVNENISFIDHSSGIWLPDGCKLTISWKKDIEFTIWYYDLVAKFFDVAVFLLSLLVTDPSFMSIS